MNIKKVEEAVKSGHWMVRFDNDGISYEGFKWNPVGEWTEAPDWNPKPVCGGGLHGQGPGGFGYCQSGSRFVFCETDKVVVIDGDKVKTNRARILKINTEAFEYLIKVTDEDFTGSLSLDGYSHPLPDGFTNCGGNLYLGGYSHPLPEGFTHCGGGLYLGDYSHPLPEGFTHCGGSLDLYGYSHPLPKGFTHCGGYLYLDGYSHPLPEGFTHCGGYLYLDGYSHPLPEGFTVGRENS